MSTFYEDMLKEGTNQNIYMTNKVGSNPNSFLTPFQKEKISQGINPYTGGKLSTDAVQITNFLKATKVKNAEDYVNKSKGSKWLSGDININTYAGIDVTGISDNLDAKAIPIEVGSGLVITGIIQNTNSYDSKTGKVLTLDKTKLGINRNYDRENPDRKGFTSFYDDRNYVIAKKNNLVIPHEWVGDTTDQYKKQTTDGIIVVATGSRDFDNKDNIRKTFEGIIAKQGNIKYIAVGDWISGADQYVVEVASEMGILVKRFIVPPGAWDKWVVDKDDNWVNKILDSGSTQSYKIAGPVRNSIMIADSIDQAGGITPDKIIGVGFFQNGSGNQGTMDAYGKMLAYGLDVWQIGNQVVPEGKVSVSMTPTQTVNLINELPKKILIKTTPVNDKINIEKNMDMETFNLIPTVSWGTTTGSVSQEGKKGWVDPKNKGLIIPDNVQPSPQVEEENEQPGRVIKSDDFMGIGSPETNLKPNTPAYSEVSPEQVWKKRYGY